MKLFGMRPMPSHRVDFSLIGKPCLLQALFRGLAPFVLGNSRRLIQWLNGALLFTLCVFGTHGGIITNQVMSESAAACRMFMFPRGDPMSAYCTPPCLRASAPF
jgi:hypothetical protein